ncbi:MAG: hypothetical protein AB1714_07780 [Acidobacteriota bacterium]
MKINSGTQFQASVDPANGSSRGVQTGKTGQAQGRPATARSEPAAGVAARDIFERSQGRTFQQLVTTPGTGLLVGKSDLPEATVHHDASGGRPKGGFDQRWVDRYKVLEDWRKRFENTIITPENRDEQESLRFMIQNLERGLGLEPGQNAVVNGETGEYIIGPSQSGTGTPHQAFDFRNLESFTHPTGGGGAGIGPHPGQGATLTGLGGTGGGGGGGVGAPGGNSNANTAGGFFGGGIWREPGSAHGHDPSSNRGHTPQGPGQPPAGHDTPSTPSHPSSPGQAPKVDRDKDKAIKVHDTGGESPTTKDTMTVVDKLIRSWDQPESESGEGLPPADETRHGGARGSDIGTHRPEGLRGITQQEIDLFGPAIRKETGPDDKDRPETGSTSGSQAPGDLGDDIGGRGISSLRRGGGGEAGPLWKDLRVLNPIDPSKV